jgi:isoleucyl-tRNA synthetase
LDNYDALRAGVAIENFIDQLSNWYVRRNRKRFWKSAAGEDKQSAYVTLYECLEVVTVLMAPFVPFLSEAVYQNLVRGLQADAPASIHMASWPEHRAERMDPLLLSEMEVVQRIVSLGRVARSESNLKVRQPLSRILVRAPDEQASHAISRHAQQIREELNVKRLEILPRDAKLVTYRIKPNLPVVGRRFGKLVPAIRESLSRIDPAQAATQVARGESITIAVADQLITLESTALLVETTSAEGFASAEAGGYLVGLETTLTDELLQEGLARELVRTVQEARKSAGLEVSDRIVLDIDGDDAVMTALDSHRGYIGTETLTSHWERLESSVALTCVSHSLGATKWVIRLRRDESWVS